MPNLGAHCAISKQCTGFAFEELHQWIDSPAEVLGADHRIECHAYTRNDANTIRRYWNRKKGSGWGDKVVIEWLFHIAIDNIHTAFKFSQSCYGQLTYNFLEIGIQESGYIHAAFDRADKNALQAKFSSERPTLLQEVG
ncbi:MAG: hypothetical protein JSW11_13665 [Candidatus Heimdallarchaeota archaeon]|nr:MAG: hypothetical protein JSW11_13665 [Candidatus Heimdallarchaeota archaeon]